jgi:hypothetical protein
MILTVLGIPTPIESKSSLKHLENLEVDFYAAKLQTHH